MNIAQSLKEAMTALGPSSESPRLDAELLLAKVLDLPRSALLTRHDAILTAAAARSYAAMVAERASGVPVAYLTGGREFWSLSLAVDAAVLVPRPETELLVERALALLAADAEASILDLGTGSGAVALALAAERPRARVAAVDVSPEAIAVARRNAAHLNLTRIEWLVGSWFAPVATRRFEMIVSNPPYIAAGDPALGALRAEPSLALTPGPTGLEALDCIIQAAPQYLQAGGWLLLEHGRDQAGAVAACMAAHGFGRISTATDFAGSPRVTLGTILSLRN